MFDESTDVSVSQNLIIYVRYLVVNQASSRIELVTSFLAIRSLFRANAESITREILDVLNEKKIPLDRLTGLATDGAAVMTGKKSGVVQRLKQIQPDIVSTHCIAHRLALSCGGAADKIPYLVKFQGLLNDFFKYFRNSGKNSASLKTIQSIVEQANNCKKFKEVFHTRWLSFDGSLQALLQNYNSLVSLFLDESSGKALALYKPITSYKFLYVAHYLADVNLIKTAIPNRINIDNLDNLMMMSIEGPDRKKFNFHKAFQKWASKCERKILHGHKKW